MKSYNERDAGNLVIWQYDGLVYLGIVTKGGFGRSFLAHRTTNYILLLGNQVRADDYFEWVPFEEALAPADAKDTIYIFFQENTQNLEAYKMIYPKLPWEKLDNLKKQSEVCYAGV